MSWAKRALLLGSITLGCLHLSVLGFAQPGDEEIGPTPTPSPSPSPTPTPTPAPVVWTLELFNVDDQMTAAMNGKIIANVGYNGTNTITLNPSFIQGQDNRLSIQVSNAAGGWTYGFRIKKNGVVAVTKSGNRAEASCGQVGVQGCNNSGAAGVVFRKGYIWYKE